MAWCGSVKQMSQAMRSYVRVCVCACARVCVCGHETLWSDSASVPFRVTNIFCKEFANSI